MAKFKVTYEKTVKIGEEWAAQDQVRIVEADYYTIYHNGEIGFEKQAGDSQEGYPSYKSILALKYWDSVEEIEE